MYIIKDTKYDFYVRYYIYYDQKSPAPIAHLYLMKNMGKNNWIVDNYFAYDSHKKHLSELLEHAMADLTDVICKCNF